MATNLREYDKQAELLIKRIRAEVKPFDDDTEEGKERRRNKAKKDFIYFLQTYLNHHFEDAFGKRRKRETLKAIKRQNEIIQIEWFRGLGKSSIFVVGYGLWCTLFRKKRYITVTSDTQDQAEILMLPVKTELEENLRIRQDFGLIRSHNWEAGEFDTTTGIRWKAFGWLTKYRGTKFMQYRPDLDFTDDLENDKNVRNSDQVKQRYDYMTQVKVPAMAKKWQIFYLTTKLARYCVAAIFEKNEAVYKSIIPAEDSRGRATCPESFPKERLNAIRKLIGIVAYAKEYLLKILSDENSAFQEDWITWIKEPEPNYRLIISFLDPSVGKTKKHDYKAMITVGWTGYYYDVLPSWIRRTTINRMINRTYEIYRELRPIVVGLETNGFQILLKKEFQRVAREKGFQLPLRPVNQKENKKIRILRLSPLVENGLIRFVQGGDNQRLIDQLLDFDEDSDSTPDDGPDALEGAINICNHMSGKNSKAQAHIM